MGNQLDRRRRRPSLTVFVIIVQDSFLIKPRSKVRKKEYCGVLAQVCHLQGLGILGFYYIVGLFYFVVLLQVHILFGIMGIMFFVENSMVNWF